jgi:hypothetical protein
VQAIAGALERKLACDFLIETALADEEGQYLAMYGLNRILDYLGEVHGHETWAYGAGLERNFTCGNVASGLRESSVNSEGVKDGAYISSRDGEERGQESSKEIHWEKVGVWVDDPAPRSP